MNISRSLKSIYRSTKKAIGEAVVGDDFFRKGGVADGVILGAAAGAATGGAVGLARGAYDQVSDQITEVQTQKDVKVPRLDGYRYSVREDWDEEAFCDDDDLFCDEELDGWWHNYSPDIRHRVVGTFEQPELKHSHSGTVVGSAITGMAVGAGIGAALGFATGVVGRVVGGGPLERKHRLPADLREQLVADTGQQVVKSTAIGAGVGAAVGLGAALLEQSKSATITRTWMAPVTTDENLGSIPRDHYEWNHGWDWADPTDYSDHSPRGTEDVIRPVPVLDGNGRATFESVTETIDSRRFGITTGVVGGALAGAGIGLGVGVASSVVNRILVQSALG